MNYARQKLADNIALILGTAALIASFFVFYGYRLATLTGLDSREQAIVQLIQHKGIAPLMLLRDSLWLPQKLYIFIVEHIPHAPATIGAKAFSVGVTLAAILSLYYIVREWYNWRIAAISGVSFALGSWTLLVGRSASPDALYMLPIIGLAGWALLYAGYRRIGLGVLAVSSIAGLYVPGLAWLIIPALIFQYKAVLRRIHAIPQNYMIAVLTASGIAIIPLLISLAWPLPPQTALHNLMGFAGLPTTLPNLRELWDHAAGIIVSLIWRTDETGPITLGGAPLLGIVIGVTALLGYIDMLRHIKLDRAKVIVWWLIIGVLLASLQQAAITMLLPAIYLLSAGGIRYLLHSWLAVFPYNPLARGLGIASMSLVLAFAIVYQLAAYFVAWPHTPYALSHLIR